MRLYLRFNTVLFTLSLQGAGVAELQYFLPKEGGESRGRELGVRRASWWQPASKMQRDPGRPDLAPKRLPV